MEIKLNSKDIYKQEIFIIEQDHKIKVKTYNRNKIKSWTKTMRYCKVNDYKIYKIEIGRVYDNIRDF